MPLILLGVIFVIVIGTIAFFEFLGRNDPPGKGWTRRLTCHTKVNIMEKGQPKRKRPQQRPATKSVSLWKPFLVNRKRNATPWSADCVIIQPWNLTASKITRKGFTLSCSKRSSGMLMVATLLRQLSQLCAIYHMMPCQWTFGWNDEATDKIKFQA